MENAATVKQFNNYHRLPLGLLSKPRLPLGIVFLISDVYSFTGEKLSCVRTYKGFQNDLGISRPTVGRALRAAKANKMISSDKEKGYVCQRDKIDDGLFLKFETWVHTEEFEVRKNTRRRLNLSERLIYSFFRTRCDNRNNRAKAYEISISELAEILGLSEKTVQKGLWVLIRAKLIYRPAEDKGVNAYKKSRYTLNYKIIRAHEKKAKTAQKPATPAQDNSPKVITFKSAADVANEQRAERERRYFELKHNAEDVAERNYKYAMQDKQFRDAETELKAIGFDLAIAELHNLPTLPKLQRRSEELQGLRTAALMRIGLTEQDLIPQYPPGV